MTDRKEDAFTTLKTLARLRAESVRGGSTNFEHGRAAQIAVTLVASGITADEWDQMCTQAETEDAAAWAEKLHAAGR